MNNVQTQQLFAPKLPEIDISTYTPFDQTSESYAPTTMLRNSAMAKLKELAESRKVAKPQQQIQAPVDMSKPLATRMAESGQQNVLDRMGGKITEGIQGAQNIGSAIQRAVQDRIVGGAYTISQAFGNRSSLEKYSGGVHYGTDFKASEGTPVAAPQGDWIVVKSVGGSKAGDTGANSGYGNSVIIQNQVTGEKLRYSHLKVPTVNTGETIKGGTVVGQIGSTGNSTGNHLDLTYYDPNGRTTNVMNSQYRNYL